MIGYRGCFRYVRDPELFDVELELLARVREETPNLHLMIPFVGTKWELEVCLERIACGPLGRQRGLKRWVMAEVPSVMFRIAEYRGRRRLAAPRREGRWRGAGRGRSAAPDRNAVSY